MKKHNREGKKRRKREKEHLKRVKVGKEQQQQHPLELPKRELELCCGERARTEAMYDAGELL